MVAYNDQFFFNVAMEIARAYPLYIVKYATRNLCMPFRSRLRDDRYNVQGYIHIGNDFIPAFRVGAPTSLRIRSRNMAPALCSRWNIFH